MPKRRNNFGSGVGDIEHNLIHEFHLSSVLKWHRLNFGLGNYSARMYSSKSYRLSIHVYCSVNKVSGCGAAAVRLRAAACGCVRLRAAAGGCGCVPLQ